MSELRTCEAHSFCEGSKCPVCETPGRLLLSASQRRQVSKFLSGALRHFPDDVGLSLDNAGWADWQQVVDRTRRKYDWLDPDGIEAIVHLDPKGRFEVDDGRIRAAYGHSVDVSLGSDETPVPETLYHGTSPDALASITAEGLKPMARQHVHLSGTVAQAREVGRRHSAEPVILIVDADRMQVDGLSITKRGNCVYTTDRVPPAYLRRAD